MDDIDKWIYKLYIDGYVDGCMDYRYLDCQPWVIAVTPVDSTTNFVREIVMNSACLNSSGIRLSRIPTIRGSWRRLFLFLILFRLRRFFMRKRFCFLFEAWLRAFLESWVSRRQRASLRLREKRDEGLACKHKLNVSIDATACFIKPYRDPVYKCTGSR